MFDGITFRRKRITQGRKAAKPQEETECPRVEESYREASRSFLRALASLREIIPAVVLSVALFGAAMKTVANDRIRKQVFGQTSDGRAIDLYTLRNTHGTEVAITTYGGIVVSLKTRDRNGKFADIVLGYDNLEDYLTRNNSHFGGIIGRYCNRIALGRFTVGGREHTLARNNGENHLHGGIKGFDKAVWTGEPAESADNVALTLSYLSKDGEEGYPGNLAVTVVYRLNDKDELVIESGATTDKETVANLTNHSYFNLAGGGTVLNHELMINAERFTPVDRALIPTGELRSVRGTPLDFTNAVAIGARIDQKDEQLILGNGYDHNFVLNGGGGALTLAAKVYEPQAGRALDVYTTEPGVQFYTGNFLNNVKGKGGRLYARRSGFCLETQHFPDSPNKPAFPSTVLKPGQKYSTTTVWRFSAR